MNKLAKWFPSRKKDENAALQRSFSNHPLVRMREEMDRLIDGFFQEPTGLFDLDRPFSSASPMVPKVDIEDRRKELRVSVDLPGMSAEDVDLSLVDNVLSIRGESKVEQDEERDGYYLSERVFGSFHRSIPLPVEVEGDKVKAKFKKGVLTVRLPKSPKAQESTRKIEVESSD